MPLHGSRFRPDPSCFPWLSSPKNLSPCLASFKNKVFLALRIAPVFEADHPGCLFALRFLHDGWNLSQKIHNVHRDRRQSCLLLPIASTMEETLCNRKIQPSLEK